MTKKAGRPSGGRYCLSDGAGVALVEEVRPRGDLGVLFEQCPALPLGHAAPDAVLDLVVERVRCALLHYRAVTADNRSLTLRGPSHKEFVGIFGLAQRLRDPSTMVCGHGAQIAVWSHKV